MRGDVYRLGATHAYIEESRAPCRGPICKATIAWAVDSEGRWHPFDVEGENAGHSHYATCPDAQRYRDTTKRRRDRQKGTT